MLSSHDAIKEEIKAWPRDLGESGMPLNWVSAHVLIKALLPERVPQLLPERGGTILIFQYIKLDTCPYSIKTIKGSVQSEKLL